MMFSQCGSKATKGGQSGQKRGPSKGYALDQGRCFYQKCPNATHSTKGYVFGVQTGSQGTTSTAQRKRHTKTEQSNVNTCNKL